MGTASTWLAPKLAPLLTYRRSADSMA